MSKMSDLQISIQEDLLDGRLTFQEIAAKHEVPVYWVDDTATELWADDLAKSDGSFNSAEMAEQYNDSMDGDFDSAMASAGYGTDEDYGCYGADDY
jgi:hypothetical protein